MRIAGLQKLTLLDFPGHTACTVFTDGCNLRCPFCHNASLVRKDYEDPFMTLDEFFRFLDKRHGLLDGVAITGGEPLLQEGIIDFIRQIKSMGFAVKLDTNGTFPHILKQIMDENLVDYIAMDIKNSKENYGKTVGVPTMTTDKIEQSVSLLKAGNIPYEFRTTIVKEIHTREDMVQIGQWLSGNDNYFLQSFVDSGDILTDGMSAHSKDTMRDFLTAVKPFLPNAELRGID